MKTHEYKYLESYANCLIRKVNGIIQPNRPILLQDEIYDLKEKISNHMVSVQRGRDNGSSERTEEKYNNVYIQLSEAYNKLSELLTRR